MLLAQDQKVDLRIAAAGGAFVEVEAARMGAAPGAVARVDPGAEDSAIAALFHGKLLVGVASFLVSAAARAHPCLLPMIPYSRVSSSAAATGCRAPMR